jgi:hypothetical protein
LAGDRLYCDAYSAAAWKLRVAFSFSSSNSEGLCLAISAYPSALKANDGEQARRYGS